MVLAFSTVHGPVSLSRSACSFGTSQIQSSAAGQHLGDLGVAVLDGAEADLADRGVPFGPPSM